MMLWMRSGREEAVQLNDINDSEILITKKGDNVKVSKEKFIGWEAGTDEKWEGANIQAESSPLIDPSTGEPRIIRTFTFAFNPEFAQKNKGLRGINEQELFNNHWKMLQIELWKDGLVADEESNPKLIFKKGFYLIQMVCRARLGVIVADTPQNLNTYLKSKKRGA